MEGGRNNAYIKKAKSSQKSPSDFSLHVISKNCITWTPSCRETGKYDFVDEHIGSPYKLTLEEEGVQGYSEAAGSH